jgi:hypothetical protein
MDAAGQVPIDKETDSTEHLLFFKMGKRTERSQDARSQ